MSTERKFARNLKGKGSAQKAREAVSEAIRERSFVVRKCMTTTGNAKVT